MDVSPTYEQLLTALKTFLGEVLPGVTVVAGVVNRVPEPNAARFVTMNPIRIERLRTNVDAVEDVRFIGAIAGTALVVSEVSFGTIRPGATVQGTGVTANTKIVSGPGGLGTYVVSIAQTVSSQVLSTGEKTIEQGAKVTVQLDFHSSDLTAADMAVIVATAFRDEYAVERFAAQDPNYGVAPLYADDPRYVPFLNENQQSEWRWVLEAVLQINPVAVVPQQFADAVTVSLVDVDAAYPP